MSAIKRLYEELKPLVQSNPQTARQMLLALGFPEQLIPAQLDAVRALIQRQRAWLQRLTRTPFGL
jgi:hypothetical protein